VRVADIIAYVNHDLDDAIRAQILIPQDIPQHIQQAMGTSHAGRITSLVQDVVSATALEREPLIRMSEKVGERLALFARISL